MTDHDTLRAVLRRVTTGALVEWAGEAADMDDIREAADAVADTLAMLDWRTLLGVPPAPEPPGVTLRPFTDAEVAALNAEPTSGGEVTADELAEVVKGWFDRDGHGIAAAILARYDVRRKP